ncbi:MAG: hypothetical protein WKF71_09610 [Pyrinomonadaceae bacterium]
MQEIISNTNVSTVPQIAVATAEDAIATVNRWLHREVGMALNVSAADFNSQTFYWHLPIHLAYGELGSLAVVGDVYLHAATGEFLGSPTADELQQRADALAEKYGIAE